ncbi:hypothetical protein F8144_33325 [Streptomyces triticiradicis]|uniref:Uncharacterized protein n=1 Tax=Streptomyces triticiradicis TaxID=2651189 RepID=A0A7J5D9B6_9ACTN|nr:hypothetical protein F8144_33325 [Streptomyces triticiradicis]
MSTRPSVHRSAFHRQCQSVDIANTHAPCSRQCHCPRPTPTVTTTVTVTTISDHGVTATTAGGTRITCTYSANARRWAYSDGKRFRPNQEERPARCIASTT